MQEHRSQQPPGRRARSAGASLQGSPTQSAGSSVLAIGTYGREKTRMARPNPMSAAAVPAAIVGAHDGSMMSGGGLGISDDCRTGYAQRTPGGAHDHEDSPGVESIQS